MLRSDVTCDEADVSLVEETNTEKPDEQDLNASNFFESTVSSEAVPPVENKDNSSTKFIKSKFYQCNIAH